MEWWKGKLQWTPVLLGLHAALILKGPPSYSFLCCTESIVLLLDREQFKTSPSAPKILLQMGLWKHLKEKLFYATLLE